MKKTNLDQWICEIEALPELTREGLESLQLKRLNQTLKRVKARAGAYRDLPEQLESLDALQTLPFTTPQMVGKTPGKYLLTSQSEVSRVISGATSGTTGPAKRVFYTEQDTKHTIGLFRAGISEMLAPGEKCLIGFPFTGPFGLGDLIAAAVEELGAVPVKAGYGQSWGQLCDLIGQTRPETFIGFPAVLLGLLRMYGPGFPIRRGLVSGDACPEGLMSALEAELGSKLYPHYGSRECGLGGAVTCQAFEGMHLRENHIIAEIVDEQGRPLPKGAYGELVITTIGMEAMPLIRYRTGDYTRILPPCPCGGVSCRLERVSRREEGDLSMELLDSTLFSLTDLVDYSVSFDGELWVEAKVLRMEAAEPIRAKINLLYPQYPLHLSAAVCVSDDKPLYPGKRHICRKDEKTEAP